MKILVTTTLNRNLTEAKMKPLVALPEVECIFYVSDRPGPLFEKVRYYCVPQRLLRVFNNSSFVRAAAKFFIVFFLALYKRPDLLMGYSFMPHGLTAVLAGKIFNIPSVINIIGGAFSIEGGGFTCGNNRLLKKLRRKGSLLEKILLKIAGSSDFITVTGSLTKGFLVSKGLCAEKIKILSSTIDINRFFPNGSNKEYDLITMAELIPIKRIDVFLRIVAALKKDNFKIKAVILGDGALRGSLEDLSKTLGLEENVRFAGFDSNVEGYLNTSKIFLLPSETEGLSLAMLEAMACGVVPVVSNVGDLSDAVKDSVNGRLVDKHDIDGFISAIAILLKDTPTLEHYSKSAVEAVRENYSIEHASKKWKGIMDDIQGKRQLLNWCFSRLKAMSIAEVVYRVIRYLRTRFLYWRFLTLDKNGHLSRKPIYKETQFFIDKKDIDFIRSNYFIDAEYGNSKFDTRYSILDTRKSKNDEPRTKIEDLVRGEHRASSIEHRAKRANLFEEDIYGAGGGDFKNDIRHRAGFCKTEIRKIWELNRFQWLVNYAQRYAIENNEGMAEGIAYILSGWINKNPALKGINWADPLEASLRLLSWAWIYFLIKDSKVFDRDFENIFLRSVYFQAEFIKYNLSKFSSANNHLIGEAIGLFITGILFPQLSGADRRMKRGKAILEQEIKRQVYPDGVSKEQSIKYHEFVIDLYLLAIIIGERNGVRFRKDGYSRLEKMCEFLLHMSDGIGDCPSIGDSDDRSAVKLNILKAPLNALSILNTASIIFNRPDFRKKEGAIDEKSLWLLGYAGYKKYSLSKGRRVTSISKGFPDGGYYIMRHRDMVLIFDCGALGYNSLAAHGHADVLSVSLKIGRRHILVDPGTYLYHSGGRWRDYFRSTGAHNTIRVDGLDQSEIRGPFLWGSKARSFIKYWSPNGGYDEVKGYHTGYTRLKDPVIHSREIRFDKLDGLIMVKDMLFSKKKHFAELFFHLHPDCILTKIKGNALEVLNNDVTVSMELDKALTVRISNGSETPICGWYSKRFGEKQNTFTICAEGYFEGDSDFITKISVRSRK